MIFNSTDISIANKLDSEDELRSFRGKFYFPDPNLIYVDGNSLGRLPLKTIDILSSSVKHEWGERLIRSWNEDWFELNKKIGGKISKIIGAEPGEVIIADSVSINLFKLAFAALKASPERNKIITDDQNFPSDIYILESLKEYIGKDHTILFANSSNGIGISTDVIKGLVDKNTALVTLSHVAYKSAFMYDVKKITKMAHDAGAYALWDLSHSAGSVPVKLNDWNVDLAVGCTYKYLNGGPGAPAFLYVKKELQKKLSSPIWGWFGDESQFDFNLIFSPAKDLRKFLVGSPPIISLKAIEPGVDLLIEAGIEKLRNKSKNQCEYLIYLFNKKLKPLNFSLASPENSEERGSHVSLRHKEAYRISKSLIDPINSNVKVIPDFREPDIIRIGIAPLYNSFSDIFKTVERCEQIVQDKEYEKFSGNKLRVT